MQDKFFYTNLRLEKKKKKKNGDSDVRFDLLINVCTQSYTQKDPQRLRLCGSPKGRHPEPLGSVHNSMHNMISNQTLVTGIKKPPMQGDSSFILSGLHTGD